MEIFYSCPAMPLFSWLLRTERTIQSRWLRLATAPMDIRGNGHPSTLGLWIVINLIPAIRNLFSEPEVNREPLVDHPSTTVGARVPLA